MYEVKWSVDPNYFAQDAVFYAEPYRNSHIVTIRQGERAVDIFVDGETKYYHPDQDWVVRYGDQWEEHGIFSDDDLRALPVGGWLLNSWFDCYNADTGEHFDAVQHEIYDAIAKAVAILGEDELWKAD